MESRQDELLSKQGKIVTQIAEDLIVRQLDERVPSMQDYAQQFDASVGTVQSAMTYLQSESAVSFVARGRLGAFIDHIDYPLLWNLSRNRPMISVLSLPYSRQLAGLATGLRAQFQGFPARVDFRYVRGSSTRMQMLQSNECDWIVVSRHAAESASVQGFDLEVATSLGADSYTINHVLLIRQDFEPELKNGMRIGIDKTSNDHAYVVRSIIRNYAITVADIEYQRSVELLLSGEIDAAVWTETDLSTASGLHIISLDDKYAWSSKLGEAVLLTRPHDTAVKHVLGDLVNIDAVKEIQHQVVTSQRIASY